MMFHIQMVISGIVVVFALFGFTLTVTQAQVSSGSFVTSPSWSVDGTKIAIAVGDNVEVYDAITQQLIYVLEGHSNFISMIAWSPDNTMIATSSYDQTVMIWATGDGTLLRTLTGHNDSVTAIAWFPDSQRLVSSGLESEPSLFVWYAQTGTLISTHSGGSITDLAFSPDGRRIAFSTSLSIGTFDSQTFELLSRSPRVQCCPNTMYSIAWNRTGDSLITGSINGLVTIWDSQTGQMRNQFVANPYFESDSREIERLDLSWVRDVTFAQNDNLALAVSGDGSLREWNSVTGEMIQNLPIAISHIAASWSPYSGRLAVLELQSLAATDGENLDTGVTTGNLTIIVPDPSIERLNAIAAACDAPVSPSTDMADFMAQVEALPADSIPPACAADLLAVARALEGG
ncbi:MAG: WD40 repeat domain-containing protein [Pleurocapsa minor GSE-CHR-MK-17-07R]|jgi:WD40 repeat protein|nr:WD40 repeat domain-containing protein [Pleurocapsa minor GSE-CHR-MK 17-07R]